MAGGNFVNLVEKNVPLDPDTVVRMKLDLNTSRETVTLQIREFKTGGDYVGPTKNGFTYRVETEEDLELLQSQFNLFISQAKQELAKRQ